VFTKLSVPADISDGDNASSSLVQGLLRYYCHSEALFMRKYYNGFITCTTLLEAVGARVSVRNI
jgi:hypothetical protein